MDSIQFNHSLPQFENGTELDSSHSGNSRYQRTQHPVKDSIIPTLLIFLAGRSIGFASPLGFRVSVPRVGNCLAPDIWFASPMHLDPRLTIVRQDVFD
jgi:hypothetical protein